MLSGRLSTVFLKLNILAPHLSPSMKLCFSLSTLCFLPDSRLPLASPVFSNNYQRISGRKKPLQFNENSKVKANKDINKQINLFIKQMKRRSFSLWAAGRCLLNICFYQVLSASPLWTATASSLLLSGEPPVSVLATLDKRDTPFMENELLLHESLKAAFTWQQVLIQYKHEYFHRGVTLLSCRHTVFCTSWSTAAILRHFENLPVLFKE